jgi:hypothetical protein
VQNGAVGGSAVPREDESLPASRAALAGLLFCALYVVVFVLFHRIPDADASAGTAAAYYGSKSERRLVTAGAVYLVPLAGIALLWFTAAVRHRVASLVGREDELLSTVQLLSAAVYVGLVFVATAALTAPTIAVDVGAMTIADASTERTFFVVGDSLLLIYAMRSAGVFIAAGTTRALRSGLIPRWFAVVSYALVLVLLFSVARVRAVALLFPAWVAVMSLVVLIRRGRSAGTVGAA